MRLGGRILFTGGCAAALVLLWLIWREQERLAAAGDQLQALSKQREAVATKLAASQKALEKFLGARPAASAPPKPATASEAAALPPPAAAQRAPSRPWLTRLFAESPNLHRLYLEAYRSELEFEHALTFEALGLTADERAGVIGILAQDMERRTDIAATARAGQMGSTDSAIKTLHLEREQETAAALRAMLGERYERWHGDPRAHMPFVSEAAMHLHRTSTPLTAAQAEQLALLARNGLSGRREGNSFVLPNEADYAAFAQEAGRVLSPEQSAVVRALIEQMAARRQLDRARSTKRK